MSRTPSSRSGPSSARGGPAPWRRSLKLAWPALVALVAVGAFLIAKQQAQGQTAPVTPPATGLPDTPDYHSLLVSATDPERVLLGTHAGVYESSDSGRSWRTGGVRGEDAMNLVQGAEGSLWVAGHEVLAVSEDGGATWEAARPEGLPGLDIHGFAARTDGSGALYAAVAGEGLYRSTDGGLSFQQMSSEVGPAVFGLAALDGGRILAGDVEKGLLLSDDEGATWRLVDPMAVLGLSAGAGGALLAAGQGEEFSGVLLSLDRGESWRRALPVPEGAGPVAWAPSAPDIGYALGFDRRLYRTDDGGRTWGVVAEAGGTR